VFGVSKDLACENHHGKFRSANSIFSAGFGILGASAPSQAEFIGKIRLLGGKLPTSLLTSAAFLKI
jgi:hypothetical protein